MKFGHSIYKHCSMSIMIIYLDRGIRDFWLICWHVSSVVDTLNWATMRFFVLLVTVTWTNKSHYFYFGVRSCSVNTLVYWIITCSMLEALFLKRKLNYLEKSDMKHPFVKDNWSWLLRVLCLIILVRSYYNLYSIELNFIRI